MSSVTFAPFVLYILVYINVNGVVSGPINYNLAEVELQKLRNLFKHSNLEVINLAARLISNRIADDRTEKDMQTVIIPEMELNELYQKFPPPVEISEQFERWIFVARAANRLEKQDPNFRSRLRYAFGLEEEPENETDETNKENTGNQDGSKCPKSTVANNEL